MASLEQYAAACLIAVGAAGNTAVLLYLLVRKLCWQRLLCRFHLTVALLLVSNCLVLLVFFAELLVPYFDLLHAFLPLNRLVRQLTVLYVPVLEVLYSYDACLTLLLVVREPLDLPDYLLTVLFRNLLSSLRKQGVLAQQQHKGVFRWKSNPMFRCVLLTTKKLIFECLK